MIEVLSSRVLLVTTLNANGEKLCKIKRPWHQHSLQDARGTGSSFLVPRGEETVVSKH